MRATQIACFNFTILFIVTQMNHSQNWLFDLNQSPPRNYPLIKQTQPLHTPRQEPYHYNDGPYYNRFSPLQNRSVFSPNRSPSLHYTPFGRQNLFDDISLPDLYKNQPISLTQLTEKAQFKDIIDFTEIEKADEFVPTGKPRILNEELTAVKKIQVSPSWNSKVVSRPRDKGLRKLSFQALQIVMDMKSATYKQVATKLVNQLYEQSSLDSDGKDESNIKRRVYDALNVMIALGLLRKQGRKIVAQRKSKKCDRQKKYLNQQEEYEKVKQQLDKYSLNIESKKKRYSQLKLKLQAVSNLIIRNKSLEVSAQKIIQFPFIGASVQDMAYCNVTINHSSLSITSTKKITIFGDVDSLNFIPTNNQS